MTLENYNFWTNNKYKLNFSQDEFDKIVNVAKTRLASFLCLSDLGNDLADDLEMVLAQFIALIMIDNSDNGEHIESKRVRNFSITFTNNTANIFAKLAKNYGDILNRYSECGFSFKVEKTSSVFDENGCYLKDKNVGFYTGWDIIAHDGRV